MDSRNLEVRWVREPIRHNRPWHGWHVAVYVGPHLLETFATIPGAQAYMHGVQARLAGYGRDGNPYRRIRTEGKRVIYSQAPLEPLYDRGWKAARALQSVLEEL